MRVVIAEDLFLLRDGLVRLVESYGHTVVAAVDDGPAVFEALLVNRPDVSIVDVRLPPTYSDEGLKAVLAARREVPGLPVLILSTHVEQLYAGELLADDRGGVGYLLKDRVMDAAQFMDALGRVAGGGTALDPAVIAKLLGRPSRATDRPLGTLTERERSVLELMAEGLSNTAIAARLFLSEGAISKYTTTIFAKLGLAEDEDTNRRVRAVLAYLGASPQRLGADPAAGAPVVLDSACCTGNRLSVAEGIGGSDYPWSKRPCYDRSSGRPAQLVLAGATRCPPNTPATVRTARSAPTRPTMIAPVAAALAQPGVRPRRILGKSSAPAPNSTAAAANASAHQPWVCQPLAYMFSSCWTVGPELGAFISWLYWA